MAHNDNILWLQQMPYFSVSEFELNSDFGTPTITEFDVTNSSFLEDLKSQYFNETFDKLNFNYFTPDIFNAEYSDSKCNILSLFHMNIRSLNKNSNELVEFLTTLKFDFDLIVLSEIWAYNIELYKNLIPGYRFYYDLPLDSNVGGIGLFVKSCMIQNICDEYKLHSDNECKVENLWLEVTKGNSKFIVGGIYRHPGSRINSFTKKLEIALSQISSRKLPCVVAGDVNVDLKNFLIHQDTKMYLDSYTLNNFYPAVVMPTRITENSATLIDHIFFSEGSVNTDYTLYSGNLWCDITDHLPNFVLINSNKEYKNRFDNRPYVRLYSPKNITKFTEAISNINWQDIYECSDVNVAYELFNRKITRCHDECFRLVRLSRKCTKDQKWITKGIKKSSRHKNTLYKKWRCSLNSEDRKKYKNYLKIFKKITLAAQSAYYKDKLDTRINTSKQLWNNLNKISSLCKTKTFTDIDKIMLNDKNITHKREICNILNKYFCSVGENLAKSLQASNLPDFHKFCPNPCKNSMFLNPVTSEEITGIIHKFPNNKAPGNDNINPKILKAIAYFIVDPLAHIFNLSFLLGAIPDSLKIAKVIPVYKKGAKTSPGNYRPISLLSIFDKIMEKLMYKRVLNFLEQNKVLYNYQFGFRKNHSTSLAVMEVLDYIYQHSDNHEITLGIYIDLQKAFDTIDHSILLMKLQNYGVRGTVLQWFYNYLNKRQQYTVLPNYESETDVIKYGVPQGSVLGPLLFLIYVNDIQYAAPDSKIKLFADDTNIFFSDSDPEKLFSVANLNLTKLCEWFTANKLHLNLDKTCYSIFGQDIKDSSTIRLYVNRVIIPRVESCKYLGIIIDSKLKWQDHIDNVYSRLVKFTSIFYKLRTKLPSDVLRMVYFAFIHPLLLYGIEVYANTTHNHLAKLKILNNKILRIIQQKPIKFLNIKLYEAYNTLPLELLHNYQILLFVHNYVYHKEKLPNVFSTYFDENKTIHYHNTRQTSDFHICTVHTELGKRMIKYKGSTLWNKLPKELKEIKSRQSFKDSLKQHLLQFN